MSGRFVTTSSSPTIHSPPFTIRSLNPTTYLVRETDKYGEYPNIYVTLVPFPGTSELAFFVICDTGCGTRSGNQNLATFLEKMVNPQHELPYLVVISHCHYDHILGLRYLPPTSTGKTTVVASSHKKSFLVPRVNLAKHSLCDTIGVPLPHYSIGVWAKDGQKLVYSLPSSSAVKREEGDFSHGKPENEQADKIDTGLIILHTPGHTPDSLTWYSVQERYISVGDSLYERESPDTKAAGEPPMPTMFDLESDLLDWWDSLEKVLAFVRERNDEEIDDPQLSDVNSSGNLRNKNQSSSVNVKVNHEEIDDGWISISTTPRVRAKKPRVRLGAAHVTVEVDAEECVLAMQEFMRRVLRDEIPSCSLGIHRGEESRLWDETLEEEEEEQDSHNGTGGMTAATTAAACATKSTTRGRFSIQSPLRIIAEGREAIPQEEIWR